MDISLTFDTSEITNILEKLPDEIEKKLVKAAVRKGAVVIKKEAEAQAPYDARRKSGTHLRDGFRIERIKGSVAQFRIGTLARVVPHAHLVEFGTIKQSPQPFFRQASITKQTEAVKKIFISLSTGILRESRKLAGTAKKRKRK